MIVFERVMFILGALAAAWTLYTFLTSGYYDPPIPHG